MKKLAEAKDKGLSAKEKQKLRNKKSAQESRLKKKEEQRFLHSTIEDKDNKMKVFLENILVKRLKKYPNVLEEMTKDISKEFKTSKRQKGNSVDLFRIAVEEVFMTDQEKLKKYKPNDQVEE